MSETAPLPNDARGVRELMSCLQSIAEAVLSAPLTRDQLMQRWGLTEVKTFQRWCDDLGLRAFEGKGSSARFRMPAILRAEERGEQRNGGSAA